MAKVYNLAKMSTLTVGTGTLSLFNADPGFLSFDDSGVSSGETITYVITDGTNTEIGRGVYTSGSKTLTRTVLKSTNSNNPIFLSGQARVFITAAAEDLYFVSSGVPVAIADGGTGADNILDARTNLGVGTGDSPQFAGINVGHASDTTVTRAGAGDLNVEGNLVYRAGGTDIPIADGGTGASTAAAAATNLGLGTGDSPQFAGVNIGDAADTTLTRVSAGVVAVEGSNILLASGLGSTIQPYDATLASIAALGTASDRLAYTTGVDTWAEAVVTAAGRAILDDADASAQRTTLGLGTIATQAANSVAITGGSVTGITDLAIADGGTAASDAATAFGNLKQAATTSATGVVELATDAEVQAATSGKVMTTDQLSSVCAPEALSDAATIAVDWSAAINFTVTLGGNRALGNPTNIQVGTWRTILFTQDGTGSRTLSFDTYYVFPNGIAPTLSIGAADNDRITFFARSSTVIECYMIGLNLS